MEEKDREGKEKNYQITVVLDEKTYQMLEKMCKLTGRARSRVCTKYIQSGLVGDAKELLEFEEAIARLAQLGKTDD